LCSFAAGFNLPALAVFPAAQTAEAVYDFTTTADTQLKQGVNEMPSNRAFRRLRPCHFLICGPSVGHWLSSRPRMRGVVGFFQTLGGQVRVHLRGHEMRVAQQLLHAAQIRAGIEQMRGVTVPSSKKKNNSEQDRLPNPISAKLPAVNF
jgi:hypothetical protein